jgi:hypothetical protein
MMSAATIPFFRPKNASTSAGLRLASSTMSSAERPGADTAAA